MARIFWLTVGVLLIGVLGCGVPPASTTGGAGGTGGGGGAGGDDFCRPDPADAPPAEKCGIWVSLAMGNDTNEGTQAAPVASLTRAIELAANGLGHVYACGGETWTEPLVVPANVSLHGGFDCANGWSYVGEDMKAMLVTPPDVYSIAWMEWDLKQTAGYFLTDFYVEAGDAETPGRSSIAVYSRDDNLTLTVSRCEVVAGNGADGLDGDPADNTLYGQPGKAGNDGANACSAPISMGGAPTGSACGGEDSGGAGGDGGPMFAASGKDGAPVESPPFGEGGLGEGSAPACTDGKAGRTGQDGMFGLGGAYDRGRLAPEGYIGIRGKDGTPGTPGQGGGGGGATFGKAAVCGATNPGGAAGGSGGSGGCGGKPGHGGQAGGASIGVASRSRMVIRETRIRVGKGGNGGRGTPGQFGGIGGAPGKGGAGAGTIKSGCAGGAGGNGGKGGPGGGGQGGPAICSAGISYPEWDYESHCTKGVRGDGGPGGDPMFIDSNGHAPNGDLIADSPWNP